MKNALFSFFVPLLLLATFILPQSAPAQTVPDTKTVVQSADSVTDAALETAYSEAIGGDDVGYHFRRNGSGYTAYNAAHDLIMDATPRTVTFSFGDDTWQLASDVPATQTTIRENRLTIQRDGYEEWYINGPLGLQQGFTLDQPAAISFDLGGTLSTTASRQTLHLGDKLTFAGLIAYDAKGQSVPVAFKVDNNRLTYVYDDTAAAYPITIDPWLQQAKLYAGDAAEQDMFGFSVALDGDTALVGAVGDDDNGESSGSAYVFVRSGTTWTQQAKLVPDDGGYENWFGNSVAIDGDTALIGAVGIGSVYVYVRSGTTWTQQAKLTPSTDGIDAFEWDVALSGDTALIGYNWDDVNGFFSGSVFVYERSGTTWTQQAKLVPSDGATYDEFGNAVAINGDTALIGAVGDHDQHEASGSAYIFVRSGTTWTQQAKLTAPVELLWHFFGWSVALSGDTALIGALGDDDNGESSGSAYVFVRNGTTWTQQAKILSPEGSAWDNFGASVALDGDTALVGTHMRESVYIYERSGSTWIHQAKLTANDATGITFGLKAALDSDTVLVGAQSDDDLFINSGSAYVFSLAPGQSLAASAACNGPNLEVTISNGDGPFDILASSAPPGASPILGVPAGLYTSPGPGTWTNLRVVEQSNDLETLLLGDITCIDDTPTITPTDTAVPPTETLVPPTDTSVPPTDTPAPVTLITTAMCVDENLAVTISAGDGPFDITASAGINTPITGVSTGTTVINGPEKWDNLTVTETIGDTESINLGQFKCRTDERPVPISPAHRSRITDPYPLFSWTGISNANNYRVFLFDDASAATRTVDIRQNSGGPTTMTLNTALPDGRLFWRVRGRQNRVWSLWSVRFTLFKDPVVPLSGTTPIPTIELAPPNSPPTQVPLPTTAPGDDPTLPAPPNTR